MTSVSGTVQHIHVPLRDALLTSHYLVFDVYFKQSVSQF